MDWRHEPHIRLVGYQSACVRAHSKTTRFRPTWMFRPLAARVVCMYYHAWGLRPSHFSALPTGLTLLTANVKMAPGAPRSCCAWIVKEVKTWGYFSGAVNGHDLQNLPRCLPWQLQTQEWSEVG